MFTKHINLKITAKAYKDKKYFCQLQSNIYKNTYKNLGVQFIYRIQDLNLPKIKLFTSYY
jgi:hypothetical protein